MTGPFHQLHHICIVVHDLERATRWYESIGIGPWNEYPALKQFTLLEVSNPAAFAQLRYRYADLDNVQLQLCQPPADDCAQRRFLDTHGEGVFHIGFEHPWDTAAEVGASVGLDVLMRGRRDNGTGFIYFDTEPQTGVVLMTRQTSPTATV
jgi:catechol 2,3-dioxygenase-like lactoylglutathione lyase family enzyme